MNDKISVLIVEDSEDDALLIIRQFKKNSYDIISKRVETASQMQTALEDVSWDMVISDYNLPEFDGPSALTVLQKSGLDIPFIVVSGAIGEETAVVLMKAGAHDCIMKDNLSRLIPVVNRELSEAQTRRERQQGEKRLKESEGQFRSIFENSVDAILLTVPDGSILAANPAACRMFGRSEEDLCRIGRNGIVDYSDGRFFDATEERVRTGTYAEKEYFYIRKDGTIFPSEESSGVFTDKDGNKRTIVIIRDITERKGAVENIRKAAEEWRTTFDSIEDMIMILDRDYRVVRVNEAVTSFLHRSYDEVLGSYCFDLIHLAKQCPGECPFTKMLNTKNHEESETFINDKMMWISTSVDPIFDNDGGITGAVHIVKNITARKKAEESLRESEERYRVAIENSNDGIAIARNGKHLFANSKFLEIFGYDQFEDILKTEKYATVHPDDRERVTEINQRRMRGEPTPARYEFRGIKKDGTPVDIEASVAPIIYLGSSASLIYFRDITEQKRAEEALLNNQKELQTIMDAAPVAVSWSDIETKEIQYINNKFTELFGYTLEDIPTIDDWCRLAYQDPDEHKKVVSSMPAVVDGHKKGEFVPAAKGTVTCKDGSIRFIQIRAVYVTNKFVVIFTDLTEQQRMEEALRENEKKLQTLMDVAPIGISWSNTAGNIEYHNHKFFELFGYTVEDIPTVAEWRRLAYPDPAYREALSPLVPAIIEAQEQGKTVVPIEVTITCKDGSTRYVEQTGTMAYNRFLALYIDITERKQMEEELRNSQRELQIIMDAAPIAVSWSDAETNEIEYLNRKFIELFGYTLEDIPTMSAWRRLAYQDPTESKEFVSLIPAAVDAYTQGESAPAIERTITCKDGSLRFIEIRGVIAANKLVVIFNDLTEQKRAEESLRESENKFRDLAEKSILGTYILQDNMFKYVNARFAEIHGYTIEELVDRKGAFDMLIVPEDVSTLHDNMHRSHKRESGNIQDTHRILTKQGEMRTVEVYVSHTIYQGKPAFFGTLVDITEQKHAEESLRESENKFRDLVEKSPVGVYLIQDGLFRYINARYAEIHGYAIEELVDKKGTSDTVLSEDMPKVRDEFRKGLKGDIGSLNTEFRIITKKRELKDVEVYGTYTTYRGKLAIIGTLVDITERKRADEMLKNLLKDLEKKNVELENTYDELRESQQKIIQQEKMASIGQLAAGVAHEINNPVGFVMSNINSMGKYSERLSQFIKIQSEAIERLSKQQGAAAVVLDDLHETRRALKIDYVVNDFINVVKESLEGAERVKRIVQDLKNFSHKDEDEHKPGDINEGIESTINVVWNELKYKANMKKEYGKIPLTKCNLGQLNQVFMNLLINAVQAIEERGEISVKTEHRGGDIVISISDTGSGIQEDKINRIFEPFFTTKEVGKGTGLGLSIAYDIVKKHNGEIMVASEIGKGTTFTVTLPVVER
jgi:PAS domain S-box-containing protein